MHCEFPDAAAKAASVHPGRPFSARDQPAGLPECRYTRSRFMPF